MGMAEDGALPRAPGRKVRLHIDGLASPMRARVKHSEGALVTAYSELGFLQMGKPLEIEDAMDGARRPALIDRVAIEVEKETRVPQLIVTLRYDDEEGRMADAAMDVEVPGPGETTGRDDYAMEDAHAPGNDKESIAEAKAAEDEESKKLKSALARGAAKVTPALSGFAKRAKEAIAMMAERAKKKAESVEPPIRRTTAPPPDGPLHASGRRVVRGEIGEDKEFDAPPKPKFKMTKKKMVVAGAVGATVLLAMVAMRKPASPPPPASATTAATDTAPRATLPPPQQSPAMAPTAPANDPLAAAAMGMGPGEGVDAHGKPMPFTNGPVGSHNNTLKLKMDGAIARIQGASQPTGFTVVIPGRKSLDSAAPLAAKDPRIAAIRIANEPSGAELTVSFKDGVPNYTVRAHGDTLEMVLAKGADKSADAKPSHKKHKKH
jgi:hypothetical protein